MDKLIVELERLYFLHGQQWRSRESACHAEGVLTPARVAACLASEQSVALELVGADGMLRAMVVGFRKAADWARVADLYQAVQQDLGLPAPALSVAGGKAYALWFSLSAPEPAARVLDFLEALRLRYLADIPDADLELLPGAIQLVPSLSTASGKWSAFIDPGLGGLFIEEPWLDMAPNMDKQADMLAGLESIKAEDFQRAFGMLQSVPESDTGPGPASTELPGNARTGALAQPSSGAGRARSELLNVGGAYSDPQSFLLAVMNDPSATARQRIRAARALLPYFPKKKD